MAADGSATSNMYGIAWSHPNAGSLGGANNLNDHGILIINNGSFRAALSSRAVFSADVRGTLFYDYNDTGYYCDPNSISNLYEVRASNWFRAFSETGLYSQSYGQHFYPDSGGFYWEMDGPIRHRDGYEGTVMGVSFYHDGDGKGHLAANQGWWLNQGIDENGSQLVIGGGKNANSYNSNTSRRLMFGDGSADSRDNYYIGTNLENYGGNYNKLDIRWHTGIRMGAQPNYGGIRFYDTEDLGTQIFAIGKDGSFAQANQSMRAPIFYDLDNTGYYVDPNSTTYVYYLQSATSLRADSDRRIKENIETIEGALDKVNKLRGVSFTRKDLADKTKKHIGLIAQEVLEVIPEVVGGSEESMYSVGYAELVAVLIEAVKEQSTYIKEQDKRILALENKLK
jgi:hypothetical protein